MVKMSETISDMHLMMTEREYNRMLDGLPSEQAELFPPWNDELPMKVKIALARFRYYPKEG